MLLHGCGANFLLASPVSGCAFLTLADAIRRAALNDIARAVLRLQINLSDILSDDSDREKKQSADKPERYHHARPAGDRIAPEEINHRPDKESNTDKNAAIPMNVIIRIALCSAK